MKQYLTLAFLLGIIHLQAQTLVKDINLGADNGNPSDFIQLGNKIIFVAQTTQSGSELYTTDGSAIGTSQILDLNAGTGNGVVGLGLNHAILNSNLCFFGNNGTTGVELYKTDGTSAGTQLVKDIYPGINGGIASSGIGLLAYNGSCYFSASDGVNGYEIWKSDGTTTGTQMLKNINPGAAGSMPNYFYVFNNQLFFTAADGVHGQELWVTDGTALGTKQVADINSGVDGSFPYNFIACNGKLFFEATTAANGTELWMTDGTTAGTQLVRDINPGLSNSAYPFELTFCAYQNKLFFVATDGVNGFELWSSDGTSTGTQMVKDIYPGSTSSNPDGFSVVNGKLLFVATSATAGTELYISDGTTIGTQIFLDINNTATNSSSPSGLYVAGNKVYFSADDGTNGSELWSTDGTVAGTISYPNICPGNCSSGPYYFFESGNNLFFAAKETNTGTELYKLDLTTSIEDTKTDATFSIYPNPATSQFTLTTTQDIKNGKITITDITGSIIFEKEIGNESETIPVVNFAKGMYMVNVVSNTIKTTQKLMIE